MSRLRKARRDARRAERTKQFAKPVYGDCSAIERFRREMLIDGNATLAMNAEAARLFLAGRGGR